MPYSRSKVNRAGELFAEQLRIATEGKRRAETGRAEIEEAVQVIEWWRREHARPLSRVAANLRHYASKQGKPVVAQRLKRVPTIAGKLLREPGMKLARMEDIGGVRAILPDQEAAYRVAGSLRKNWTITRTRDYVEKPKSDGYRALHLINRHQGRRIEIQLRTPRQDRWANTVEICARVAPGLKSGGGPAELREFFLVLGEVLSRLDLGVEVEDSLVAQLEEGRKRAAIFFQRQIDES